jgi:hypothetical protein
VQKVSQLDKIMFSGFVMLKSILMCIDEVICFKVDHQLSGDNFSKSLDRVLSKEIGRSALKIGTVLLVFSLEGNLPLAMIRLKIWARGTQISVITCFNSFIPILSRSQLFLDSKVFISSHKKLGPTSVNTRFSRSGYSGINSIGSTGVVRTDSEIVLPMSVKKLLNSLAISCGSDICSPPKFFKFFVLFFYLWLLISRFPKFFWIFYIRV